MLSRDVVVMDRHDAEMIVSESNSLLAELRRMEASLYNARDDASRTLYGHVRSALGTARYVQGIAREAVS